MLSLRLPVLIQIDARFSSSLSRYTAYSHLHGTGCPDCGLAVVRAMQKGRRFTREQFIEQAREVHGDRYNYSKVVYAGMLSKLVVICPVAGHGEFYPKAANHIHLRSGCPKCGLISRSEIRMGTLEDFIAKAREVHGDRYGYKKAQYQGSKVKLEIVCLTHGSFWQAANNHVMGQGCPDCGYIEAGEKGRLTYDKFLARARGIHGSRYDYGKSVYIGMGIEIEIECSRHGSFFQKPSDHLAGNGCQRCGQERLIELRTMTTETFVAKARTVHSDRYDYSQTRYVKSGDPVTIICQEHGEFAQVANTHLAGHRCPNCALRDRVQKRTRTTEEFITKAGLVHGDTYRYDNVEYVNSAGLVAITCRVPGHGDFMQSPNNHLRGAGCPICMNSVGEINTAKSLERYNVRVIPQWSTPARINRFGPYLRADFLLPDHRVIVEYDGKQHFEPILYFAGGCMIRAQKNLEETQERDRLKNQWAADNHYTMIRIPYWEDVDAYLNTHLLPRLSGQDAAGGRPPGSG